MPTPLKPPASWFNRPSDIPTDRRLTITDDGHVFGYVALFDQCHTTMGGCVKPPRGSASNYQLAHTGETIADDGTVVATANIGGGAGHMTAEASPEAAAKFYADTSTQLMRVKYGEDSTGVWFSGALWPDISEIDVARIRASAISGDWRPVGLWRRGGAKYDFTGACFVNVPGYATRHDNQITNQEGQASMIAASAGAMAGDIVVIDQQYGLTMTDSKKPAEDCKDCDDSAPIVAAATDEEVIAEALRSPSGEELAAVNMKLDDLRNMVVSMAEMLVSTEGARMARELSE